MGGDAGANHVKRKKMTYHFAASQRAKKNLQIAYDWYELQRKGLGEEFIESIDAAFNSVKRHPLFYGFRRKNVRGCRVKGFPY